MRNPQTTNFATGRLSHLLAMAICAFALFDSMSVLASAGALLSSAQITPRGPGLELRFGFSEVAPKAELSAHGDQLWIDLSNTSSDIPPRPLFGSETPPLKTVRIVSRGGRTRIVVEVDDKSDYAVVRHEHELLLRIAPAGAAANLTEPVRVRDEADKPRVLTSPQTTLAIVPSPEGRGVRGEVLEKAATPTLATPPPAAPPVPSSAVEPASVQPVPKPEHAEIASATMEPAPRTNAPLIMIDPGHGGDDPGTISGAGVQEKDLALKIAQKLKTALETRGFRAQMTRSTDVFIPLPERTRIANRVNADLFVSIHLNSSPNSATTGIEVYYLNNTTDRATIRLARMENGPASETYGARGGADLNYILSDLRQQYKASEAASLARMIDDQTVSDLEAGLGFKVNALGAKKGPFYVLVGAHMPAVLVECGFLSNSLEAERLAAASYQNLLADGIAAALGDYLNADAAAGNL